MAFWSTPYQGSNFFENTAYGFFSTDNLRDAEHASKIFTPNNYELSPRFKFLYHVYFRLNTTQIPQLAQVFDQLDRTTLGIMVKNIQLPSYQINVETMNQYNRKRLVQTNIEYQPCQVVFHDDGSDLIRSLWYNYFSYYYKDPSQAYMNVSTATGTLGQLGNMANGSKYDYNGNDIYAAERNVADWGYIGESYVDGTTSQGGKPPFFSDITIYGFDQHKFASYVLINPMITDWKHDTYDYSEDGGVMTNTMTIKYETVKYYSGNLTGTYPDRNAQGFADPARYDTVKSPLARGGSTSSILGNGGLLDTVGGVMSDLQSGSLLGLIGAVQKGGAAYQTFKGANWNSIVNGEVNLLARNTVRQGYLVGGIKQASNAVGGMFFPQAPAGAISPTLVKPATLLPP